MIICKKIIKYVFALVFFLIIENISAQDTIYVVQQIETIKTEEPKNEFPKFKLGGLFQARYLESFKDGVDVEGLQHSTGTYTRNSYEIKRMRVSLNARLSKNLSLVTLVNLADFKSDPKTKVLENAFARYSFNQYFRVQIGQFRPAFGIEDSHPVDIIKSIDWTNAYYLMGNNGWQSFQIGASFDGTVNLGKIPFHYAVSMTNGNGKNKLDNNSGKHYAGRFSFDLDKKNNFVVGFSTGGGKEFGKTIYALGVDATYAFRLADKWTLDFQAEAYKAINQYLYFSLPEANRDNYISDYVFEGFYVIPNLRYEIGIKNLHAIDFSIRYEYLDANAKLDSNPRQTIVPMLSFEFLKNYGARIQIGAQIDRYKHNIQDTKTYNANLAFVQFQCRLQ